MSTRPRVTVLGSLNMDISVTVPRLPGPGATVLGDAARFTPGGKGANQAVAAARLGAEVRMVGCVGADDFGRQLRAALRTEGVNADGVRDVPGAPTGLAMISVDAEGENLITVAPGANQAVGQTEVDRACRGPQDVLVISAEIPALAIRSALRLAGRSEPNAAAPASRAICVLNLAPAPADPAEAAALARGGSDWLVVNEPEAAAVLGRQVSGLADAGKAAAELVAAGARNAVVTAGAHGAAVAGLDSGPEPVIVPGFRVHAVDTVGAGDTFVGALAVALAAGVRPAGAVRAAGAAGAAAVTRYGAQTAMPHPADILAATGWTWP
jgi:ribokinase